MDHKKLMERISLNLNGPDRKELMELVNRREEIHPHYSEVEPGRSYTAWLWFIWVVIPTAAIIALYLAYLGVMALKGN